MLGCKKIANTKTKKFLNKTWTKFCHLTLPFSNAVNIGGVHFFWDTRYLLTYPFIFNNSIIIIIIITFDYFLSFFPPIIIIFIIIIMPLQSVNQLIDDFKEPYYTQYNAAHVFFTECKPVWYLLFTWCACLMDCLFIFAMEVLFGGVKRSSEVSFMVWWSI